MLKIARFLLRGMVVALILLCLTLLPDNATIASEIDSLAPTADLKQGIGWEIKSRSGPAEIKLAKHLTRAGAKMYGAYWCPHCYEQEQLFGKQAWKYITYVECADDAIKNPQPKVCKQAGVTGFPTWSIDGKLDAGTKKLAELGKLTGYRGNTAFRYDKLFGR
jgi:glutaredoxin